MRQLNLLFMSIFFFHGHINCSIIPSIPVKQIRKESTEGKKKILVVSFGKIGGHAALTDALVSLLQYSYEIDIMNTEDLERFPGFDYYRILQLPSWIVYFVQKTHHIRHAIETTFPKKFANLMYKLTEFRRTLDRNKYDLIIFVTGNHTHEINRACIKRKIPCMNIIADYGEPVNSFWIREKSMIYLVPEGSYFERAAKYHSIQSISGIPIRLQFNTIRQKSKAEVKKSLGLDENRSCVLVFFGAAGSDSMELVAKICKNQVDKQFVFLCGSHDIVRQKISKMKCSHFIIKPYVSNPAEYVRAADILIGKPGATSVTEAIQCETPCIFEAGTEVSVTPIEQWTLKYVESKNYGIVISNYTNLPQAIDKVLKTKYIFHNNNALTESLLLIHKVLSTKDKWVNRLFNPIKTNA